MSKVGDGDYVFSVVLEAISVPSAKASLECLRRQSFGRGRFECIVVTGPAEEIPHRQAELATLGCEVTVLAAPSGHNQVERKAVGWRRSKGDIIAFLDDGMLPEPAWLEKLYEALVDRDKDAVFGARYNIDLGGGEAADEVSDLAALRSELCGDGGDLLRTLGSKARIGYADHPFFAQQELQSAQVGRDYPDSPLCAYGFRFGNIAVRRSALADSGGVRTGVGELAGVDLGLRLWEANGKLGFAEGAFCYRVNADAGQELRFVDKASLMSLFYHHPYCAVFMANLSLRHQAGADSGRPSGGLASIALLAETFADGGIEADHFRAIREVYSGQVPADCRYDKEEMARYFHDVSGVPLAEMSAYLDSAVSRGLLVRRDSEQVFFDIYITTNWLRSCTPYQQYLLKHNSYDRNNKTLFQKTGDAADLVSLYCQGRYEITIDMDGIPAIDGEVTINIPLPAERPEQERVRVQACHPADLLAHADPHRGMILKYPVRHQRTGKVNIWYDFECLLHERSYLRGERGGEGQAGLAQYMRLELPPSYRSKAEALLARITTGAIAQPWATAEALYKWFLDHFTFREYPHPFYRLLDTGCGTCVQQAKLFANLCRMKGIPARERCGAILNRAKGAGANKKVETVLKGHSPFIHTWAEFYTDQYG